jgi:hypothetical protein
MYLMKNNHTVVMLHLHGASLFVFKRVLIVIIAI